MKNLVFALFLSILIGCQISTDTQTYGEVVPVEQFAKRINDDNIQLIDVRTPQEFADGHIANATNMDVKDSVKFQEGIHALNKSEPVYVYCKSGRRSQKAAKILKENRFEKIVDLEGGYKAWEKQTNK